MKAHRPTIMGTRHMIAATHYLAAEAGFKILEAGGNAIDAGVAAGIALGVVQPEFVNFAGVAPIIIYSAAEQSARHDPRARHLAEGARSRLLHEAPRRKNPARHHAHRGAGGARRLDHGAGALRHDELRRGRAVGDRLARDGFPIYPLMDEIITDHEAEYRTVSVERRALSAERAAAAGRRSVRAVGSRRHAAIHGRPGKPPRARADAKPASPPRATPSIAATSRARSSSIRRRTAASSPPKT